MHSHVICICTRVAAAAEEVVYEVVAEPQEPQGQAPQQEIRVESAQGPTNPSAEKQTQNKSRCTSYYFKIMTPIYVSITCALGLGIVWNPSCMIPRFPWVYTSMYRSLALLYLIVLDRSRVISGYSRDIGYLEIE